MDRYDVIVVGAGFAGPVAAKKCAEAGLKTLLVERSARPAEKVQSSAGVLRVWFEQAASWLLSEDAPIERAVYGNVNHFVSGGEIVYSTSTKAIIPILYHIYAFPFINWEVDQAVKAGAELRLLTTAVDVIKHGEDVSGIVTDKGERIEAKIVIDAEGARNLLAIKAGVCKKYPAESVQLHVAYVFDMREKDIERVMDGNLETYWAAPEEKIVQPPGEGTMGFHIFPMKDTIHLTTAQILAMHNRRPLREGGGAKLLQTYFDNFFKIKRWQENYEPHVTLRARKFGACPIFANLFDQVKQQHCYCGGMMTVGDAGSFGIAEGQFVGPAWLSADMAADVAADAIGKNDVSASALKAFEDKRRNHPLLKWIDSPMRRDQIQIPRDIRSIIRGVQKYHLDIMDHSGMG